MPTAGPKSHAKEMVLVHDAAAHAWRRDNDPCPACRSVECKPAKLYPGIEVAAWETFSGRMRGDAIDILRRGNIQPLSQTHHRFLVEPEKGAVSEVYWNGKKFCCQNCSGRTSHVKPCKHILAVLGWLGLAVPQPKFLPADVHVRDERAWTKAAAREDAEMPVLLRKLVEASRPWLPDAWLDRDNDPCAVNWILLLAAKEELSLRKAVGKADTLAALGVIDSTFSHWVLHDRKNDPLLIPYLERLLMLSTMPAAHLSRRLLKDATGVQSMLAHIYGLTKHMDRTEAGELVKSRQYQVLDVVLVAETGLVPSLITYYPRPAGSKEPKGPWLAAEAPYTIPLLERIVQHHPGVKFAGGDKGLNSDKHHLWCELNGIESEFQQKDNFQPGGHGMYRSAKAAATRVHLQRLEDPEGWKARKGKRNAVEGSFSALKRETGGSTNSIEVPAKDADAYLKVIVQNVRKLLYNDERSKLTLDFDIWAGQVFEAKWHDLRQRALDLQPDGSWRQLLREHNEAQERPVTARGPPDA